MKQSIKKTRKILLAALAGGLCICGGMLSMSAVSAAAPAGYTLTDGAYIRIMEEGLTDGLRFETRLTADKFNELKNEEGSTSGILLLPTEMLGTNELTADTQNVLNVDTSNKWFNDGEGYVARACLTDMSASFYNTAVSARAYIKTTAGYEYTDYTETNNSRSMAQVAKSAIDSWEAEENGAEVNYDKISSAYAYLTAGEIANNGIYKTGAEIYALPTFEEAKPAYTVTGPDGAVEVLNGNKMVMDKAGVYTAVMGDKTLKFSAFEQDKYEKIVAPLDYAQTDYSIRTVADYAGFAYDPAMGAYKVSPVAHVDNDMNAVAVDINSEEYRRIAAGCEKYTYLAMDMLFTMDKAEGMFWWMNTENKGVAYQGSWFDGEIGYFDAQKKDRDLSYAELTGGKWYTVYIQTGGLSSELFAGESYRLFSQRPNASDKQCTPYWVKNIRFADAFDTAVSETVKDGYVYKIGESVDFTDEIYGAAYKVTGPSGEITLGADNKFTFSEAGEYTATCGSGAVDFKVVTAEDFAEIIAPLDSYSEQFSGITAWDNRFVSFRFDPEMGAYKAEQIAGTTFNEGTTGQAPTGLKIAQDSVAWNALSTGVGPNKFIAFDIYYEGTPDSTAFSLLRIQFIGETPWQWWNNDYYIIPSSDVPNLDNKLNKDDGTGNWIVPQGTWLTVYVKAPSLSQQLFMYQSFNSEGIMNNYWVKNFRFVDQAETGMPEYGI